MVERNRRSVVYFCYEEVIFMSFNEKLQYLRKENKLSQEQLADMLDVTRQSVSKWESGTTYPEMDKLIMLCKIFKCSLDDLTNDEVTDMKDVGKKSTSNNIMAGLLDNCLEIINKTIQMFKSMSFRQIVGCVVSLLILGLFLALLRLPFEGFERGIYSILQNIGHPAIVGFLSGLFNLIIDIIYFALYILLFVYIYKTAYLDKYEFVDDSTKYFKTEVTDDKEEVVDEKIKEEKIVRKERVHENRENTLFKILGGLVVGFVKFLVAFAAIPTVMILMVFCFLLVIDIYLFFEGIVFIGTFCALLFSIVLAIWFLELLSIFIFNRKASFKRLLWTFIVSIIGVSMSGGLFVLELSKIDFIDSVPSGMELVTKEYEYQMKSDFIIGYRPNYWQGSEYVVDDSMGEKVKIQISSYEDFVKLGMNESLNTYDVVYLNYYGSNAPEVKKMLDMVKDNLKEGVIYNYDDLHRVEIKVIASKKNIEAIKANTNKYFEEQVNYRDVCDYETYENQLNIYEEELDDLRMENNELKDQIRELEDYKNRVQDILGE